MTLLEQLSNAAGTPGNEDEVRAVIRQHLTGIAEFSHYKLGSMVCRRQGGSDSPRVMLAGHLDEIGFIVRYVTHDGFIKFHPLGSWWEHVLLAHHVTIKSAKGDIQGIIGAKPIHHLKEGERKTVLNIEDMCIDVGAGNTGIVGTGHHYYWIGTPDYWLWWGGIFSALEPLPILFMVIDTMRVVRERKIEIPNRLAMNWAVGCAIMHFFGAGVWGFAHTLPQINQWTHGTQITAAHGHFAFYGAYAMLNLTMIYFALPQIRGLKTYNQALGRKAFWFMNFFMLLMVLTLTIAGIVQVYFQRILGMDYLTTQDFMRLWYAVFWGSAWGFAVGVVIFFIDFYYLVRAREGLIESR